MLPLRTAKAAVDRSMQYATRDRRAKKRTIRALWIVRLNAAVREHGMNYSTFMGGLIKAGIEVNRKVLSDIAIHEPAAFATFIEQAKAALTKSQKILQINGGATNGSFVVRAPISGFVVEKTLTNNMAIRPDNTSNLFTISDLKNVWVLANLMIAIERTRETNDKDGNHNSGLFSSILPPKY